ncbi:sigma factor [Sorangium sp. So ce1153]|uniref:sigma factor n=1 Tax=Sorangium sp. So ce1153 TaxID=3133333 RepID=UPI003F5EF701
MPASRAPGAVERLGFVTTIRASLLRQARRRTRPRCAHPRGPAIDEPSPPLSSPASPAAGTPERVAGCRRNGWPGHRNRWPGAVGTGGRVTGIDGRVPSERVAGSGRNRWPDHAGIRKEDECAAAHARLFCPTLVRAVLRWLGRLGVPLCHRGDVAGQVWLNAWESWPRFDPRRGRPERWLNAITVHLPRTTTSGRSTAGRSWSI